ncbi:MULTISPECIES: DUF1028 domain-containing protein [unclassified Arcicella]|uniref:DUF1028 domain-containing protein n=1 Tax=unclassified Arcicella TaxID=2644986 RepID=UPI00285E20FF|nr:MULTISPECIES: DUF1028 domain-containing protein [unclassified Arcicella]MDR6562939.1 putative Ntn-hydrolase superfamily protein [Arcicella sp. BE51]MDR6813022.1 putative Ntn-hydrolase superfamily protein [Arcicella sp. BE140]MDR6824336.1 putative Ntn-hydrolase superfamily protein [Arcicella sp. BE139]
MKKLFLCITFLYFSCNIYAQFTKKHEPFAHTFSIVARDSKTGEMAVGVQSHWFSVGTAVSWGQAGVGVIATQSFINKSFGIRGLALLKSGKTAQEALDILLSNDGGKDVRQVGIVDAKGNVAVHTGKSCVDFAGHIKGTNYSVQSNMMLNNKVPSAMSKAFQDNWRLPLAERVLKALEAGQAVGGDIRGKQSAALLVVKGTSTNKPWDEDHLVDLRVDDHQSPLIELARLLKVRRAYDHMDAGDLATETSNMKKAMEEYSAAMKLLPNNTEMQYWTAITMANNKSIIKASEMLQKIYAKEPNWREMTKRLPKVGLLKVSDLDLKELTK